MVALSGPFIWTNGHVCIFGMWLGPDLQLNNHWSEVQSEARVVVQTWLRWRLSIKGKIEACAPYVFPIILYQLAILLLRKEKKEGARLLVGHRIVWWSQASCLHRDCCSTSVSYFPGNASLDVPSSRFKVGLGGC